MPKIEEHRIRIESALGRINAHAEIMENKEYTSSVELQRDMAIGVELGQTYVDVLGEIVEDDEWMEVSK